MKERGLAVITDSAPEPELQEPYGAILTPEAMAPCTSDVNTVYGTGSKKPCGPGGPCREKGPGFRSGRPGGGAGHHAGLAESGDPGGK